MDHAFAFIDFSRKLFRPFYCTSIASNQFPATSLIFPLNRFMISVGGSIFGNPTDLCFRIAYKEMMNSENRIENSMIYVIKLASMHYARGNHGGIELLQKYIYVIGGNGETNINGERYDILSNRWSILPANNQCFTRGSLMQMENRYLYAFREKTVIQDQRNEFYAEKLDIFDEDIGWIPIVIKIPTFVPEPLITRSFYIADGKILIYRCYNLEPATAIIFDLDKQKKIRTAVFNTKLLYDMAQPLIMKKSVWNYYWEGSDIYAMKYRFNPRNIGHVKVNIEGSSDITRTDVIWINFL